uniref:Squalene cyclase C-terminal domain-containing protein n=1 Tax=Oscillatoriales cyanobacterium SpSt-402 TaxID=2282168 RepID=A0A832H4A6_9CYAN
MFANSMTEHSYVECTASCLIALQAFQRHDPTYQAAELTTTRHRAGRWLRQQQQADGSWSGFWGVNFIYGTLFGIYGLLATENSDDTPAIQKACRWLISKQRSDGGWGEHFQGCLSGQYVEHTDSQVTQTAWALMALLKANAQADQTITKGVNFLIERQLDTGNWPKQDMSGLFFQTALLDYTLYRSYFPLWAIALYASKQKNQLGQSNSS